MYKSYIPKVEKAKVVLYENQGIHAYALNTHIGIVRKSNEDRMSVIFENQEYTN